MACPLARVAMVVEVLGRCETAARLDAALHQMAVEKVGARHMP